MRLVVVGGQARKVGKTSVIAGLIRGLSGLAWTAVKISHHEGDAGFEDALSAGGFRETPPRSMLGWGLPRPRLHQEPILRTIRRPATCPRISISC